jgi:hypothetical protein
MTIDFKALAEELPKQAIHWRAQTVTKNGDKALALAYLDARDVMDRLDQVCGPDGWQNEYVETAKGRIICRIGIRSGDEWIWKGDGAGDTDVEGEKGGISDALKRAAVHWGIGRYLYRLDAVWCPCETYQRNGKSVWKRWTDDPWNHVRGAQRPQQKKPPQRKPDSKNDAEQFKRLNDALKGCDSLEKLHRLWMQDNFKEVKAGLSARMQGDLELTYAGMQEDLE